MELYLDSINLEEIKEAAQLGYLTGLTTTPTFMLREGVRDIDAQMLEIAKHTEILQVEALGSTADEIVREAGRLADLGLLPEKTVFKIPISLEGTKACKRLVNDGFMVNLHLVYTVQQAYMAFRAGATYVCPLVGRLQDQGHDALALVKECVHVTEQYGYPSKVMFSSVRHVEHVRNALNIGAHACTIPWKVMKNLTENHFTTIGADQFVEDTRLLTTRVREVARKNNISIPASACIIDALVMMSKSKLGAVAVMNKDNSLHRLFTDGDLRRLYETSDGNIQDLKLSDLAPHQPVSVDSNATLIEAMEVFKAHKVDNIMVSENGKVSGILDIQDLIG